MFQLVLDRKQIEEVLRLGLVTLGFKLVDDKMTWQKKIRPVSVSVNVVADVSMRASAQNTSNEGTSSSAEPVPPPTIIQNQDMTAEEIERVLQIARTGNK